MQISDVVIVGLGAMGAASAYQLARRGVSVVGIDRHSPPHDQGSSHGETRITRQGIGEGDDYVPFVRRSHEIWREIEAETGDELLLTCGTLVVSRIEGSARHHGKDEFLARTIGAARRFGIPHEELTAAEVRKRLPQFAATDAERGYFEPGGGLVFPERCIAAQLKLARMHGAILRTGETVLGVEPNGTGVRVTTDRDTYEAQRAVLSAGAWNRGLAAGALSALEVHRQAMHWYEPVEPDLYASARCPVFIWIHGAGASDYFYGFPTPPGGAGVKIGTETYLSPLSVPEEIDRAVPEEEAIAVHRTHLAGRLLGLLPRRLRSATCFYTTTPDGDFVIDRHPDSDRITIVSACSGHGFKHSAAIGETVADVVTADGPGLDLSSFALARLASRVPESAL